MVFTLRWNVLLIYKAATEDVRVYFFKFIYYTDIIYKMYKDKLQNCSCNQFHYIDTYKQVETNNMTMNRGENNGSEKF